MKQYLLNKKKVLKTNEKGFTEYMEIPYIEYREDGSIKCEGTEDFSADRYRTLIRRTVYTPSGKVNKGNHTIWDMGKEIVSNSNKDVRSIADILYKTEYQLRQY
jgi:translation initiation factor 2 beta subunit (eIF-2beta)/eIF-5